MRLILRRGFGLVAVIVLSGLTAAARGDTAAWPVLSNPSEPTGGGESDAAVLVGVEDYGYLPDVPGARDNIDDWYDYLTATLAVLPERITLLRDQEAVDEQLRRSIEAAADQVGRGGTLWFVFVGRGLATVHGDDGVMLGVDARPEWPAMYQRSLPLLSWCRSARSPVVD